jgi:threonine synthase
VSYTGNALKYVSTRGKAPVLPFDDVLLAGLADDGGLYVPATWPRFSRADIRALRGLPYSELVTRVMLPYVAGSVATNDFEKIVAEAYKGFDHIAVAPLKQIGADQWLLELFHGPTLSFKDYALQVVGRLFDHVLTKRGKRVTIVGATSGDTGSAAIHACADREAIEVFILHPKGRVSDVQRRQMTTVAASNVHNVAIEGTFDDCQDLVKSLFNDHAFRDAHQVAAVNSINWARIMVQISYYFAAAAALGAPERPFAFSVPTGNFGNVFSAYAARHMGLGIERLIVATNANDILARFLASGRMKMEAVAPTISPSMDIQISSNFERLLFDYYDRDGHSLAPVMEEFRDKGDVSVGDTRWRHISELFLGHRMDDEAIRAEIRHHYAATGEALDPHSAIGVAAARSLANKVNGATVVSVATAHPAKFPDAVEAAIGTRPAMPPSLAALFDKKELCQTLPNDAKLLKSYITHRLKERAPA